MRELHAGALFCVVKVMEAAIRHGLSTDQTTGRRRVQQCWSVVLAGGEDNTLHGAGHVRLGIRRPSQYRELEGSDTLLEQTLQSAVALSTNKRVVTLIGAGHAQHLDSAGIALPGTVIEQPRQRGTAPAALLCAAYVLARDPDATITFLPADQFAAPRERLHEYLERAQAIGQEFPHTMVLLGAQPTFAEEAYGWLEPGEAVTTAGGTEAFSVRYFKEKPAQAEAEALFARGCLWNSFILTMQAATLWETAWAAFPVLMERLESVKHLFAQPNPQHAVDDVIARAFTNLPTLDLSRQLFQPFTPQLLTIPMQDLQWSDWGRPRRIVQPARPEAADAADTLRIISGPRNPH